MREPNPYVQLNLPSHHLPLDGADPRPASARDSAEIDFRRSRREGALVLDQQRKGLIIADRMVKRLVYGEVDDGNFTPRMLAITGFNTSFYIYARGAGVMDRRLALPILPVEQDGDNEWRNLRRAGNGIHQAVDDASKLYLAHQKHREGNATIDRLGKSLGDSSARLGLVGEVWKAEGSTPFDAQFTAREHLLKLLEEARTIASTSINGREPMGSHPSMLQLADEDSHLSVYWRRYAPNAARDLLEEARTEPLPPPEKVA